MQPDTTKPELIIIGGPTGIGKTSVAIEIARRFGGEIVNADSMQIYRKMDIGTAKPTPEEQASVKHHLIDIINPDQPFDAVRFADMAGKIISRLVEKKKLPLVVGGTGLYTKALAHGLFRENSSDPEVRKELHKIAEMHGSEHLYRNLEQVDPATAGRLHPNDTFRIIRALEVYRVTGAPISDFQNTHRFSDRPYQTLKIGLDMDRKILYDRINSRVEAMVDEGLVEEVKQLLDMGYSCDIKPMQSIGYRHMADFIQGRLEWDEALDTMKRDTRRYAKRQLTWFRKDPEMIWFHPGQVNEIVVEIGDFLKSK
ncbi:MAG TPA: tRNA (adenosine(37)-N6)-dimethylallyltransferase MiaA [Deltaproteobacteria bacterium]|nr:tRNA (adenosine(37)-N6)-dimethylallyltransferase MiaA [Deltaproteobacteria bacterium]